MTRLNQLAQPCVVRWRWLRAAAVAALAWGALVPASSRAQGAHVMIRGRVTDAARRPVRGATITATSIAPRETATGVTDATGEYLVHFAHGGDQYTLVVTAASHTPVHRALRRRGEHIIVADVQLGVTAHTLPRIDVRARRRRKPPLVEAAVQDVGALQESTDFGTARMVLPGDRGDLAATVASLPGVTLVPSSTESSDATSGFSVLGLAPGQNAVMLNGLHFGGGAIPRSAPVVPRLSTSLYDPSFGGFSGGRLDLMMLPGSNFVERWVNVTLDDPALQSTDAVGERLGQRHRNVQVSGTAMGPVVRDELFYSVTIHGGHRARPLTTLLGTDDAALRTLGTSRRAADSLVAALAALGVPTSGAGLAQDHVSKHASLLARVDVAPTATQSISVTANSRWHASGAALAGPTAVPPQGGEMESWSSGVQAEFAGYVATHVLSRTRAGISLAQSRMSGAAALPEGRVLVASAFPDGTAGLATLRFGSSNGFPRAVRTSTWQITHDASWFTGTNAHRLKATVDVRRDAYMHDQASNRRGTFSFNSLAELMPGHPTSFTRTLASGRAAGAETIAALAIGDLWRVSNRLQLQYGARLEGNRFGPVPRYNPAVDTLFGVRTDHAPSAVHVSPRAGFTWSYGSPSRDGTTSRSRRGVVRGGLGEFRSLPPASLLAPVLDATGLPGASQYLRCVGPAAPVPDWAGYARDPALIPDACVDGGAAVPFIDASPPVTLVGHGYAPPRSWRANLGLSRDVRSHVRLAVDAVFSLNLDQPATRDFNFAGTRRFTLSDEAGRLVFIEPEHVVPATGSVNPSGARVSNRFGRVVSLTSDARSETRQLRVAMTPATTGSISGREWALSYAYTRARERAAGFDAPTFGDPREAAWARGPGDAGHHLAGHVTLPLAGAAHLSVAAQLRSGAPFTPIVDGDVNGDGLASNDRAFVFDPARTGDSAVARGLATLMRSGAQGVRECLTRQLGRPAERNSCRAPWTAALNASLTLQGSTVGLPRRGYAVLTVDNVLGGLDLLTHGDARLRGWGRGVAPDPVLLSVTKFDPAARRFSYVVNPTFGDTRTPRYASRLPFQVTLEVSLPLAPSPSRQLLDEVLLPGRRWKGGQRTADQIKQRYAGTVPNPFRMLAMLADSLLLTTEQTAALGATERRLGARTDSIWTPVATSLGALGDRFDPAAALRRVEAARQLAWDALADAAREVRATLTTEQFALLSPSLRALLSERTIARLRKEGA